MKRSFLFTLIFLSVWGCSGLVVDRSPSAIASNDYTLFSACEAMPGRGADICRVKEGAPIEQSWKLIMPVGMNILGGELTVYFKGNTSTYAIEKDQAIVQVPFKEFFAAEKWERGFDGEALALAEIRYVTQEGIEEIVRARGIAKVVVTRQGYDPIPIDSGFHTWETNCQVQYSTAGRSAIKCTK